MKILIRTDASLAIGTGHVMRSLTLADALRLRGCACVFVCREYDGHLGELIRRRGYTVTLLAETRPLGPSDSFGRSISMAELNLDWEEDAEQTSAVASKAEFDLLIVDHYALDIRWESKLRPLFKKIMVIDDLADRQHDCDLIHDQNLIAGFQGRYATKVPKNCLQMLGPKYALLQPHYAESRNRLVRRSGIVRRVLIYFGGADIDNLTGMAIASCLALPCHVDVVVNPRSPHVEALRMQVQEHARIVLHQELPTLATLMSEADLAIGACGVTSWERCCLGLPAVVITLADNQIPIAEELNRLGLVQWLGHKDHTSISQMSQALESLVARGIRPGWSEQCSSLVDGIGAVRVSEILCSLPLN